MAGKFTKIWSLSKWVPLGVLIAMVGVMSCRTSTREGAGSAPLPKKADAPSKKAIASDSLDIDSIQIAPTKVGENTYFQATINVDKKVKFKSVEWKVCRTASSCAASDETQKSSIAVVTITNAEPGSNIFMARLCSGNPGEAVPCGVYESASFTQPSNPNKPLDNAVKAEASARQEIEKVSIAAANTAKTYVGANPNDNSATGQAAQNLSTLDSNGISIAATQGVLGKIDQAAGNIGGATGGDAGVTTGGTGSIPTTESGNGQAGGDGGTGGTTGDIAGGATGSTTGSTTGGAGGVTRGVSGTPGSTGGTGGTNTLLAMGAGIAGLSLMISAGAATYRIQMTKELSALKIQLEAEQEILKAAAPTSQAYSDAKEAIDHLAPQVSDYESKLVAQQEFLDAVLAEEMKLQDSIPQLTRDAEAAEQRVNELRTNKVAIDKQISADWKQFEHLNREKNATEAHIASLRSEILAIPNSEEILALKGAAEQAKEDLKAVLAKHGTAVAEEARLQEEMKALDVKMGPLKAQDSLRQREILDAVRTFMNATGSNLDPLNLDGGTRDAWDIREGTEGAKIPGTIVSGGEDFAAKAGFAFNAEATARYEAQHANEFATFKEQMKNLNREFLNARSAWQGFEANYQVLRNQSNREFNAAAFTEINRVSVKEYNASAAVRNVIGRKTTDLERAITASMGVLEKIKTRLRNNPEVNKLQDAKINDPEARLENALAKSSAAYESIRTRVELAARNLREMEILQLETKAKLEAKQLELETYQTRSRTEKTDYSDKIAQLKEEMRPYKEEMDQYKSEIENYDRFEQNKVELNATDSKIAKIDATAKAGMIGGGFAAVGGILLGTLGALANSNTPSAALTGSAPKMTDQQFFVYMMNIHNRDLHAAVADLEAAGLQISELTPTP
jgi:hypothetical protein